MSWSRRSFTTCMVGMQFYMPWSAGSFMTCPSLDATLRHAMVETQLFSMPWSRRSFTTYMVGIQFYDMPCSGRNFTACPSRNTVLRHTRVETRFYDFPWSGYSYSTCPGRHAVYDMSGGNAVLRHSLKGTQFYDMPYSELTLYRCVVYVCCVGFASFDVVYYDLMSVPGMLVCSSLLISVCMFIVSKGLRISSATVIVMVGDGHYVSQLPYVWYYVVV